MAEQKDDKADDQQQTDDQTQQNADDAAAVEAEAKQMGWVPKDEFHGNEADWADAATFVQRGKEINPILRKNNQRLMKELEKRDRQIAELQLTTKEFAETYAKMSENAYKRAIEDVTHQIKVARREGNDEDVETLTEQRDELKEQAKNVKIPGQNAGTDTQASQIAARETVLNDWISENEWFDQEKNPRLFHATQGLAISFAKTTEGKALAGKKEFLERIAEQVKALYPEEFKNKRRAAGSPVEGGGTSRSSAGGANGKKTYADLPADAKAACDRQTKNIKGFTKEKYVEHYFAQPGT